MTKTSERVGYEKRRLTYYAFDDFRVAYQASRLKAGRVVLWSPEFHTEAEADAWIKMHRGFDKGEPWK